MSEPSNREAAIAALVARLQRIVVANGFNTDGGATLFVGQTPTLGPDDPVSAIAVVFPEDAVGFQGEHVVTTVPVEIQAIARADAGVENSWFTVEAVIADIKRAVELREEDLAEDDDRRFGSAVQPEGFRRTTTRALKREEGSTDVGAAVSYELLIVEGWGHP